MRLLLLVSVSALGLLSCGRNNLKGEWKTSCSSESPFTIRLLTFDDDEIAHFKEVIVTYADGFCAVPLWTFRREGTFKLGEAENKTQFMIHLHSIVRRVEVASETSLSEARRRFSHSTLPVHTEIDIGNVETQDAPGRDQSIAAQMEGGVLKVRSWVRDFRRVQSN